MVMQYGQKYKFKMDKDIIDLVKRIKDKRYYNKYINYTEYVSEHISKSISYAEYVSETVCSYNEYITEPIIDVSNDGTSVSFWKITKW